MSKEQEVYKSLCEVVPETSPHLEGVVVAADLTQEWLLPWWWENYSLYNDFPVTFVDLGLSNPMKEWCKEKGNYVKLPISGVFVTEKENLEPDFVAFLEEYCGNKFWKSRSAWFRKPLACLQSPYEKSLWLDLDCEIKGPLKELFSYCDHPSGLSIVRETLRNGKVSLNTGVVAFQKGTALIREWAALCFTEHLNHQGDQDVLDTLHQKNNLDIGEIPPKYNCICFYGVDPNAVILHWQGSHGKFRISHEILKKNLPI